MVRIFVCMVTLMAALAASHTYAAQPRRPSRLVGPQDDLPARVRIVDAGRFEANRAVGPALGRFVFEDDDWCWTPPRIIRRPPPPPPERFGDGSIQRLRQR
jgi:hypothetical protein